jgi:hypothetical protein
MPTFCLRAGAGPISDPDAAAMVDESTGNAPIANVKSRRFMSRLPDQRVRRERLSLRTTNTSWLKGERPLLLKPRRWQSSDQHGRLNVDPMEIRERYSETEDPASRNGGGHLHPPLVVSRDVPLARSEVRHLIPCLSE